MTITISKRAVSVSALLALVLGVFLLAACDNGGPSSCDAVCSQQAQQTANTLSAVRLDRTVTNPPSKTIVKSVELQNQADRYARLNNPSEVGYIYVIAYNLVFGPYQVIGKCSSTESQYSSPTSVVDGNQVDGAGFSSAAPVVIPSAQPDGSYGQNEQAIFCFLDDSAKTMVEFNAQWIWTEKPLLGLPTVPGSAEVNNGK